ncbi:macrodomain Ter protein MatP [Glaesserella parasuis]|uniref:Macrodomain Ter protein n=4 Tax=Glaesserella parasuis TaxID=738 RepID=B8F8M0_GLAP5|nr:macrodomain Ter protein MatP [Glaesserella parasuis]EPZ98716.1 organizer of macrodomain of terminus of chromosome family protein [Glaesserella parasuis MN-H]EQA04746.1 organizer of macrodomain of terminus of chromosome family protein [Glaesserella parasuis 12939]EQA06966.1 organizer of macrodomain of terminus of chromosome family protein [Glaesserella parasuis H465]EQA11879.1 organizer of macrodomain of terminus of chromosome family protein [Glaesserella parasuis 174]EQA12126.1 organizer of
MRYQKLEIQEASWKWKYLLKKYREGENITKYDEQSLIELKVQLLTTLQNSPEEIEQWIKAEMTSEQRKKMRQSIRARRKRFFNAEKQSTRKKSIDLEYASWQRLSKQAKEMDLTLSETIHYLIDELEKKQIYAEQVDKMKANLKALLG